MTYEEMVDTLMDLVATGQADVTFDDEIGDFRFYPIDENRAWDEEMRTWGEL